MEHDELQTAIAKASYVVRSLFSDWEPKTADEQRCKNRATDKLDELEMWVGRGLNASVRYERRSE